MPGGGRGRPRRRVLIVNAYFDDLRRGHGRFHSVPKALGPVYLAGAFAPECCEIVLYNEQTSGTLDDPQLLGWPDMLVLTGLTVAFDRCRQLAAYAKTRNPAVITVAGGPAVRAMPHRASLFFDYICTGDVEDLGDVVRDAWGSAYVARDRFPRFDLAAWLGPIGYLETSRNCNFRCSFCSLTGESNAYGKYALDHIRRQLVALGRRRLVIFVDNNFYGNDRNFFLEKLDLIKNVWKSGQFKGWTALVTQDFFLKPENLELVRAAGCLGLFSGVESFDSPTLVRFNKRQNTRLPQIDLIRDCLEGGLVFLYGIIFDLSARTISDCRREIRLFLDHTEITLPAFVTQTIPLLGTPYFFECLNERRLLPNARLRDMDGSTLVTAPLDPLEDVARFLRDMPHLRGFRVRVGRHAAGFVRRYGRTLNMDQLVMALGSAAMIVNPTLRLITRMRTERARTFVTGSEPLDRPYAPAFPVDRRYVSHFTPTMVTDREGRLHPHLLADLAEMTKNVALKPARRTSRLDSAAGVLPVDDHALPELPVR